MLGMGLGVKGIALSVFRFRCAGVLRFQFWDLQLFQGLGLRGSEALQPWILSRLVFCTWTTTSTTTAATTTATATVATTAAQSSASLR